MERTVAAEAVMTGAAGVDGIDLRPARASDLGAIEWLLEESGLPTSGVRDALDGFVVAEASGRIIGVAGLEVHGVDGLIRSVAVRSSHRGRGLGSLLTERVVETARSSRLRRLYLLTTTAESWFPRHGFRRIERGAVSPEVGESIEFREACPASAVAMVLELDRPAGSSVEAR